MICEKGWRTWDLLAGLASVGHSLENCNRLLFLIKNEYNILTEIGFLNILQMQQLTVKIFWSCEMRCSSKTGFLSFQQHVPFSTTEESLKIEIIAHIIKIGTFVM
jgi:hypothetical protein